MLNQTNAMNTETWVGNLIGKNTENKNIKILESTRSAGKCQPLQGGERG